MYWLAFFMSKPFKTYEELIEILKKHKLITKLADFSRNRKS